MSEPRIGESPNRAAWACWIGPERDGDGQPSTLHVAPTDGAHVLESDAEWVRERLREAQTAKGRAPADPNSAPEIDVERLARALLPHWVDLGDHPTGGPGEWAHDIAEIVARLAVREKAQR